MFRKYWKIKSRGFTLAEVLITITLITIIGFLALIGINPLMQIFRGYDAKRKSDLYKLKNAFEAYYVDHDCYPSTDILKNCGSNELEPYLTSIPCDPQENTPYSLTLIPPDSACPQRYAIYAKLLTPDPDETVYAECPDIMAVTSPNMTYVQIVAGCSGYALCPVYYGCQNGLCAAVARDTSPSCAPNYCDPDCGGVNCGKVVRKRFVNECVAI